VSFLLDTNVVSELHKGSRCNPRVAAWFSSIRGDEAYLSALVIGEIRKGIEQIRPRDPVRAANLEGWLRSLPVAFLERVLPVDMSIAEAWGRLAALRTIQPIDGLMAATAKVHGLTLVTRNVRDVSGLGVEILNPFEPR
jgi:toxin FitB